LTGQTIIKITVKGSFTLVMRNYNMDFIRGIAVLCLVYMNGYAFGLMDYIYTPLATPPFSDAVIHTLSSIFIDGRFRTLFSLLFGAGLFIQWQRYKSTIPIKARLYWLIIFGLAHGFCSGLAIFYLFTAYVVGGCSNM